MLRKLTSLTFFFINYIFTSKKIINSERNRGLSA